MIFSNFCMMEHQLESKANSGPLDEKMLTVREEGDYENMLIKKFKEEWGKHNSPNNDFLAIDMITGQIRKLESEY